MSIGLPDGNESDSNASDVDVEKDIDEVQEVDSYTNHDMVERAFQECDLNHEGRLSYEEFKMWVERNPALLEHIESILPYNGPKDITPHHNKRETLPHMKKVSRMSLSRSASYSLDLNSTSTLDSRRSSIFASRKHVDNSSPRGDSFYSQGRSTPQPDNLVDNENEELTRSYLLQALEATHSESVRRQISAILDSLPLAHLNVMSSNASVISIGIHESGNGMQSPILSQQQTLAQAQGKTMESFLWKHGKALHLLSKRYYLLSGNCLFYYAHENDVRPKGVIFLTGCLIESVREEDMALKGYYGFELLHQDHLSSGIEIPSTSRHTKRVLYCKSEEERERWVFALQHAAQVVPIEDDYVIGREVGRGRFSIVCECVHKVTGQHCAVKIINKATIEPEEKQLLRTEIAVLKLVNHPNIIHLEGIYESKQSIYIVMEMLQGGELFQRIVGRPRYVN